jgi:hypothetical protein
VSVCEGDAAAIGSLVWNWGEAYVISYANGLYHAQRRDNGAQVHAPDPEQLDREIQADYSARPVPREPPACPMP